MITIKFSSKFFRNLSKFESDLQEEVLEKISLFKDQKNHAQLKVHKLKGGFSDCYSFSVNYKVRIIFQYLSKKEVVLLTVGDHEVYK